MPESFLEMSASDRQEALNFVASQTGRLRSDDGPEFVARDLRKWLAGTGAKTTYIEPGSP